MPITQQSAQEEHPDDPDYVDEDEENFEEKYAVTIMDIACRWIEIIPLKDIEAATVCNAIDLNWFCRYPRPKKVIFDKGSQFIADEFKVLLLSYGIQPL